MFWIRKKLSEVRSILSTVISFDLKKRYFQRNFLFYHYRTKLKFTTIKHWNNCYLFEKMLIIGSCRINRIKFEQKQIESSFNFFIKSSKLKYQQIDWFIVRYSFIVKNALFHTTSAICFPFYRYIVDSRHKKEIT